MIRPRECPHAPEGVQSGQFLDRPAVSHIEGAIVWSPQSQDRARRFLSHVCKGPEGSGFILGYVHQHEESPRVVCGHSSAPIDETESKLDLSPRLGKSAVDSSSPYGRIEVCKGHRPGPGSQLWNPAVPGLRGEISSSCRSHQPLICTAPVQTYEAPALRCPARGTTKDPDSGIPLGPIGTKGIDRFFWR